MYVIITTRKCKPEVPDSVTGQFQLFHGTAKTGHGHVQMTFFKWIGRFLAEIWPKTGQNGQIGNLNNSEMVGQIVMMFRTFTQHYICNMYVVITNRKWKPEVPDSVTGQFQLFHGIAKTGNDVTKLIYGKFFCSYGPVRKVVWYWYLEGFGSYLNLCKFRCALKGQIWVFNSSKTNKVTETKFWLLMQFDMLILKIYVAKHFNS